MGVLAIGDGGHLTKVPADAGSSVSGYPLSFDPTAKHLYLGAYPYGTIELTDVNAGVLVGRGSADDGDAASSYEPARTFAWVRP